MSLYLYVSIPDGLANELRQALDPAIILTDAGDTPIEKAALVRQSWLVYSLAIGMTAESLVGIGAYKESLRRKQDRSHLLVAGQRALLSHEHCPFVGLLLHGMRGDWTTEKVHLKTKQHITLEQITAMIPKLEEDVLYIIGK
ncbi:MAG: hypothetical protein ACYC0V_14050, partial [Armatimonadota bacterium]